MPPNEVDVKLIFTRRRSAKVMGKLAEAPVEDEDAMVDESRGKVVEPREGDPVRGILVTQQNSSKIVAPEDLSTYTPLRVGSVSSRLHVPFVGKIETLRLFLNEMFRGVDESTADFTGDGDDGVVTFIMHGGQVQVIAGKTKGVATVEWDCSPVGDVSEFIFHIMPCNASALSLTLLLLFPLSVADSVVALIMHAQSSAASIRLTGRPCSHRRKKLREGDDQPSMEEHLRALHQTLSDQFLSVEATYEARKGTFEVKLDAKGGVNDEGGEESNNEVVCTATVEFEDDLDATAKITVECEDEKLAGNVRECLQNVAAASAPISIVDNNIHFI